MTNFQVVTDNLTSVARVLNQRLDSIESDEHRAEKSGKTMKNVEDEVKIIKVNNFEVKIINPFPCLPFLVDLS